MKEFNEILSEIENDKTSGSSKLVDNLIDELIQSVYSFNETFRNQMILNLSRLANNKPFFAVLDHLLQTLQLSNNWRADLEEYKSVIQSSTKVIAGKFLTGTQDSKTFLLHSNSKTIVDSFGQTTRNKFDFRIFQTQSEPDKEGIIQGNLLKQSGFDVITVDDDPPISILQQVDCFVTGADLIMKDEFVNKSGTRLLAEKINKLGKPYLVLADQRKFTSKIPNNLPSTFEKIPRILITNLISS